MNIKKLSLIAAVGVLSLAACKKEESKVAVTDETVEVVDATNAENVLDFAGEYKGTLPCASCPGIETNITLAEDGTFTKSMNYIDEEEQVEDEKGSITWSEDGSTITLGEDLYKVGENQLTMLDQEGKVVTGETAEFYILKKTVK